MSASRMPVEDIFDIVPEINGNVSSRVLISDTSVHSAEVPHTEFCSEKDGSRFARQLHQTLHSSIEASNRDCGVNDTSKRSDKLEKLASNATRRREWAETPMEAVSATSPTQKRKPVPSMPWLRHARFIVIPIVLVALVTVVTCCLTMCITLQPRKLRLPFQQIASDTRTDTSPSVFRNEISHVNNNEDINNNNNNVNANVVADVNSNSDMSAAAVSGSQQCAAAPALLCEPLGGLNDVLRQFGKCVDYAQRTSRKLIMRMENTLFGEPLGNYFTFRLDGVEVENYSPVHAALWQHCSALPTANSIKAFHYINFTQTYNETVVLHRAVGGGNPRGIVEHMSLQPRLLDALQQRICQLPGDFIGIHIRNTDYASDLSNFYLQVADRLHNSTARIFVATDNATALDYFRSRIGERLVSFSKLPQLTGAAKNLHTFASDTYTVRQRNDDAILDVLTLASAKELYFSFPKSGYSRFAHMLQSDAGLYQNFVGKERKSMHSCPKLHG